MTLALGHGAQTRLTKIRITASLTVSEIPDNTVRHFPTHSENELKSVKVILALAVMQLSKMEVRIEHRTAVLGKYCIQNSRFASRVLATPRELEEHQSKMNPARTCLEHPRARSRLDHLVWTIDCIFSRKVRATH